MSEIIQPFIDHELQPGRASTGWLFCVHFCNAASPRARFALGSCFALRCIRAMLRCVARLGPGQRWCSLVCRPSGMIMANRGRTVPFCPHVLSTGARKTATWCTRWTRVDFVGLAYEVLRTLCISGLRTSDCTLSFVLLVVCFPAGGCLPLTQVCEALLQRTLQAKEASTSTFFAWCHAPHAAQTPVPLYM